MRDQRGRYQSCSVFFSGSEFGIGMWIWNRVPSASFAPRLGIIVQKRNRTKIVSIKIKNIVINTYSRFGVSLA